MKENKIILTSHSFYNPFFIIYDGRQYELSNIKVYDENGFICETERGWFGSSNNYLKEGLTIDCDLYRKLKHDFTIKSAYIIKSEKYSNVAQGFAYELCINKNVLKLENTGFKSDYNFIRNTWSTNIEGVTFETIVLHRDGIYKNLYKEKKEALEELDGFYSRNLDKMTPFIDKLNDIVTQAKKAKKAFELLDHNEYKKAFDSAGWREKEALKKNTYNFKLTETSNNRLVIEFGENEASYDLISHTWVN